MERGFTGGQMGFDLKLINYHGTDVSLKKDMFCCEINNVLLKCRGPSAAYLLPHMHIRGSSHQVILYPGLLVQPYWTLNILRLQHVLCTQIYGQSFICLGRKSNTAQDFNKIPQKT